jgi:hypothetical protein
MKPTYGSVVDSVSALPDQPATTFRASSEDPDEEPIYAELRNPSDALNILARASSRKEKEYCDHDEAADKQAGCIDMAHLNAPSNYATAISPPYIPSPSGTRISIYKLVENGVLLPSAIQELLHM